MKIDFVEFKDGTLIFYKNREKTIYDINDEGHILWIDYEYDNESPKN
jgi:predicted Holliday junction resolvase-like endonuclease